MPGPSLYGFDFGTSPDISPLMTCMDSKQFSGCFFLALGLQRSQSCADRR